MDLEPMESHFLGLHEEINSSIVIVFRFLSADAIISFHKLEFPKKYIIIMSDSDLELNKYTILMITVNLTQPVYERLSLQV